MSEILKTELVRIIFLSPSMKTVLPGHKPEFRLFGSTGWWCQPSESTHDNIVQCVHCSVGSSVLKKRHKRLKNVFFENPPRSSLSILGVAAENKMHPWLHCRCDSPIQM